MRYTNLRTHSFTHSHRSTAAAMTGEFAAEHGNLQQISIDIDPAPALSSKCGKRHVEIRGTGQRYSGGERGGATPRT